MQGAQALSVRVRPGRSGQTQLRLRPPGKGRGQAPAQGGAAGRLWLEKLGGRPPGAAPVVPNHPSPTVRGLSGLGFVSGTQILESDPPGARLGSAVSSRAALGEDPSLPLSHISPRDEADGRAAVPAVIWGEWHLRHGLEPGDSGTRAPCPSSPLLCTLAPCLPLRSPDAVAPPQRGRAPVTRPACESTPPPPSAHPPAARRGVWGQGRRAGDTNVAASGLPRGPRARPVSGPAPHRSLAPV